MKKILLYNIQNGEAIANELIKSGDYELRVISNISKPSTPPNLFAPDVLVCAPDPAEAVELRSADTKVILVYDTDSIDIQILRQSGADDFILNPISIAELKARIERLIAPENHETSKKSFSKNGLKIDFENAQVYYENERIHLTLLEYKLLCLLAKNYGQLVAYNEILHALWESPIGNEMLSIRVFVTAIRKKLAVAGATDYLIRTHAGKGYSLI